ncbi:protein FAM160B1 isoform X2 [Cephus cinctus]|uniref:Protein FAM160B1 isoform X2 n=1 Tax=Cephus cinctus TaxID=211228 RepID=A0AAJ7BH56_CEPCN|nr:protein FAM160B1 isoform X2 [Cephus cinctus]
MLRRLRKFKKSIAPPATPLEDFTYHWKQLMNFYVNHLSDRKASIESSGIPRHLDRLLEILLTEEKGEDSPGPCLEYLLQHRLLDLLATLAGAETPPGMRLVCLSFLRKLLGRSKHPLLHHVSVYAPVHRLIALCNGHLASPIEAEEIQFLLTLCFLVCKYPPLTRIVNDASSVHRENSVPKEDTEKIDAQRITYVPARKRNNSNPLFEPLNTQAVMLINPNLFATDSEGKLSHRPERYATDKNTSTQDILDKIPKTTRNTSTRSSGSISLKDVESISESSSPVSQKLPQDPLPVTNQVVSNTNDYGSSSQVPVSMASASYKVENKFQDPTNLRIDSDFASDNNMEYMKEHSKNHTFLEVPPVTENSKCFLVDALISYLNTADNTVRVRACEGIMVLASLDDSAFAHAVSRSDLPTVLSKRLEALYNSIPAHVDPNDVDEVDVTWGLDSPMWTNDNKFPGCRQVAAFFMWLDYCDQLIREAHLEVGEAIAKTITVSFFDKVITPALVDHHVVLITALLTKCLKEISSPLLSTEISHWLVGQHRDPELPNVWTTPILHRLIDNCCTESNDLTLETLKLFEEMIEKRNEHILHCLVLTYLITRGYYDNSAADSAIASWSDEEDEREREKKGTVDLSREQNHSRTLAPTNIHRIINCFLSLVPRQLQTDSDVNNYERYMADWEKQYSTVLTDCALLAWPLEAVTIDDSASSDSRPEADHCSARFYMGPFLTMILDKVSNIPNQRYEINLQLTVVISRLALLPHPYLHEFLLNPLLPLAPGTKSLFACLQRVVKQLVSDVPKTQDYKHILRSTRQRLLENCSQEPVKENILYDSVIITEEFCKELAAIAYVKYHRSM